MKEPKNYVIKASHIRKQQKQQPINMRSFLNNEDYIFTI